MPPWLLKHGKGVVIHKHDGTQGFSEMKDFPTVDGDFETYFGQFVQEKNKVLVHLKFSSDESLMAIKSNLFFHGFIQKNHIYLFPQRFNLLKIQRIGFFVGQTRYAWCPALEYNVTMVLHEEKANCQACVDQMEHLPPLDLVPPPPKIMILPGVVPHYYHKQREQVYTTTAPCLWCDVSDAAEIRDFVSTTKFDPCNP